jgi:transcriptional regulator with XRE-family HTH domain
VQARVLELGTALRDARLAKSWSQVQLAERSGVSQPEISRIENGSFQQGPTTSTMCRIAHALGARIGMVQLDVESSVDVSSSAVESKSTESLGQLVSAPPADELERIYAAALAGDRAAERRMLEALRPGVRAILRFGAFHRWVDAEDLTQETLRVVLERVREKAISDPRKVFSFAASIARNLALSNARKALQQEHMHNPESAMELEESVSMEQSNHTDSADRRLAEAVVRVLQDRPSDRDHKMNIAIQRVLRGRRRSRFAKRAAIDSSASAEVETGYFRIVDSYLDNAVETDLNKLSEDLRQGLGFQRMAED